MSENISLEGKRSPNLFLALIPIIALLLLLSLNVWFFGDETLSGANQIALLLSAGIGSVIAVNLGYPWLYVRSRIVKSISDAMPSMLILLMIGALAGTWMLSGVVPAMIYYGLQILHPTFFLAATVIISSLVSLGTGSSWSTVATIGVALLGIGQTLGFNSAVVAGAIVSGAYFGDKMSPLSDTTNLAPAMAGTDLFTHIRYMVITTTPSILITILIFAVMGFYHDTLHVETGIESTRQVLRSTYNISPILFIVPVVLITVILLKTAPLPSLMIGTLLGGIFAVIFQPQIIAQVAGFEGNYLELSYVAFMKSMFGSISISTSDAHINELLKTRGMGGMLNTIWLILSAMVFGGVMDSCGLLSKITSYIIRLARNTASLVASTVATCLFFNITASDQYLSIVVPGRMFAETYRKRRLKPEVLSRALEDSGTVTSVLIPWNTCGATQSAVLGIPVISFAPYAFFNIISPFMSIFVATINYKIRKIDTPEEQESIDNNQLQ